MQASDHTADFDAAESIETIDLPEMKAPLVKKYIKNLTDFGDLQPLAGAPRDADLKMHPYAHPKGGFIMADEEKIIPAAIKEMTKKIAGSLMKGQLHDITKNPAPAYLHHYISFIGMVKNDMT